jgi:Ni/Co efflux regulator RcnB
MVNRYSPVYAWESFTQKYLTWENFPRMLQLQLATRTLQPFQEPRLMLKIRPLCFAVAALAAAGIAAAQDVRQEDRREDRQVDRREDRQADRREDRRADRREDRRADRREDRPERLERHERHDRAERPERAERQERAERVEHGGSGRH